MEIILYVNDAELGPLPIDVVKAMLDNGDVTKDDYAWFEGCDNYVTVGDIPGIDTVTKPDTEVLAFVWPHGSKDWQGPHSLPQIQTLLARRTLAPEDFAAWEGSPEGATVSEIPGLEIPEALLDGGSPEQEEPQKASHQISPTATPRAVRPKRGGKKKNKAHHRTNAPMQGPQRGLAVKSKAFRDNLYHDPLPDGGWIRITAGIVLILTIAFNVYAGLMAPGMAEDFSAKQAPQVAPGDPLEIPDTNFDPVAHTQMHAYGLWVAAGFCLLSTCYVFVAMGNFPVMISGYVIAMVGIWGIVAAFFGTTPFIFTSGLANLMTGILTLSAAKCCY